jgi:hypothetical protein
MKWRASRRVPIAALALVVLVLGFAPRVPSQAATPSAPAPEPKAAAPQLLGRVAAVGASLSHGFGNDLPLARLLEEAIRVQHAPVLDASVGLQFLAAVRIGEEQIDRCLEHRATLVVGVDFLFWYGYGLTFRGRTELERRRKTLRIGLAQLERLDCPIVIGDLPDMRGADKRMLNPAQIPDPTVLEALNREIHTWARARKKVLLVPLAEWVKRLKAGEWKVAASSDGRFPETVLTPAIALQWDRLHPTRVGTIVLVDRLVKAVKSHFGEAGAGLQFDVWRALEREKGEQSRREPDKKAPPERPVGEKPSR